jgi:hypothetical protein
MFTVSKMMAAAAKIHIRHLRTSPHTLCLSPHYTLSLHARIRAHRFCGGCGVHRATWACVHLRRLL